MERDELVNKIIAFLESIGIAVVKDVLRANTFLPGLQLRQGALVIDLDKLCYPGDILHEAGHLATMPPDIRENMNDTLPADDLNSGGEMMAHTWSYAACVHLDIDPNIVFHGDGYKGGGDNMVQNFLAGRYIGLPLLQWAGMAFDERNALENKQQPYPHMIHWLRPPVSVLV